MIIDAHQHIWDVENGDYPWLGPDLPLWNRTFTFEELLPQLQAAGVGACVTVQSADNAGDTALMIEAADAHPEVVAIVAYAPLEDAAGTAHTLETLAADDRVVGVRNLIHTQADPDYILRPDVDEGLGVLESAGKTFDLVSVLPRHLEHVPTLGERHPDLPIVIDHLSKPPIGEPDREPWWSLIAAAAANPRVYAKISGLYPGADPMNWNAEAIKPFIDRALELFGPSRLMYGGDWPISVASGGYQHVIDGLRAALADLGDSDAEAIWGGTAAAFYRISPQRLALAEQEADA